ncbi:MAG: hypothetical protein EHM58_13405 [Ignavibacteriae bacterium]|nr:MAG: hypothetical protein EHM58_13405 [Ignavibacteriota bacterium]
MNSTLYTIFSTTIRNLQGFQFEDFINNLFLKKFGSSNYLPTRPKRDKGCDGIICSTKTVIACYGPENYDYKIFCSKAKDDYKQYKIHWKKDYSNWQFVVNHKLSPDEIKYIGNLHSSPSIIGLEQILNIIDNDLNNYQQRELAKYLKIDVRIYFTHEYISEILEDLLKLGSNYNHSPSYNPKTLVEIETKIKINFDEKDVQSVIGLYEDLMQEFSKIDHLIKNYEDEDKKVIKNKIIADYSLETGNFKERLNRIKDKYLQIYSNSRDDNYEYYIKAVLLYHFEQCIIGEKVK